MFCDTSPTHGPWSGPGGLQKPVKPATFGFMFRETSPFALLALIFSGRALLRARLLLRPAR